MRLQRLTQSGFDHVLVPLACFVVFALVGSYFLYQSLAAAPAAWKGSLQVFSNNSGYCLTATGTATNDKAVLDPCKANDNDQVWLRTNLSSATVFGVSNNQEFELQLNAGANECLNDPGGSRTNDTALQLYPCKSTDTASTWVWGVNFGSLKLSSHQLINLASVSGSKGLCVDDNTSSKAAGAKVQVYSCKTSGQSNQSWFEDGVPSSSTGSSGSAGGGTNMIVGVNINGVGSNPGPDIAGAVKYVRADLDSWGLPASTFTNSGIKVDDLLQGPYSTKGISGLGSPTTWASNALGWYKSDGCNPTLCPIIEVLNEPGGTWFWGSNALSLANATAYDNVLIATYNAFTNAYGSSRPLVLASFDGGYSTGSDWGQYMWQANPKIGNYINGITAHPYTTSTTALGSQSDVTDSYAQAKSLAGRSIPMYITEVGWQTTPTTSETASKVTPQTGWPLLSVSLQCSDIYNFISWSRGLQYVNAVMIFDYRDDAYTNDSNGDGTFGIDYANGSHKPSYAGIAAAAQNKADPCP